VAETILNKGSLGNPAVVKGTTTGRHRHGQIAEEGRDGADGLGAARSRSWRRRFRWRGQRPPRVLAKRKLAAASRLQRGDPLEFLSREIIVTSAWLADWRDWSGISEGDVDSIQNY
jgi:hypothetical protein